MKWVVCAAAAASIAFSPALARAQSKPGAKPAARAAKPTPQEQKLETYKTEAAASVDSMAKLAQEMVDSVFSFGELGFQEFETSQYLTAILEKNGFTVKRGVSDIPT